MASEKPSPSLTPSTTPPDASIPTLDEESQKAAQITASCDDRDVSALIDLSLSPQGLVRDDLRRRAWPILLGCHEDHPKHVTPWAALPVHRDEEQAAKDVNRAFVHYPKENDKKLDGRKEELSDVIVEVLRRHPSLCYFQGFHDIVQVLYLVLGPDDAPGSAIRLSLMRIRDYMLPSITPAIRHLELLPGILRAADPVLYDHLPKIPPTYALAATLTLFSHVIDAYTDITRLFDFFLASDTPIPIYFFASMILERREELLEIEQDEDEAIFFYTLGKLPKNFDIESEIQRTRELYVRLPPETLGWAWWRVSSASVLKATRSTYDVVRLTLEESEALFRQQERDMRIEKMCSKTMSHAQRLGLRVWRQRRRNAICLSLLVGVYALWLGKQNGASPLVDLMKRVLGVWR